MNQKRFYNNATFNYNFNFTTMTKDSKYTLAHYRDQKRNNWNRTCPQCGKREFSPYIDLYTGRPIDDKHCGKCNRETNCGYHQPPREWFVEHRPEHHEWLPREEFIAQKRQERREAEEARRRYEEEQRKKPRFDCFASKQHPAVQAYLDCMSHLCKKSKPHPHNLAQWLYSMFSHTRVDFVLERYRVGGTKDGRTVYWQTDLHNRVRVGKVMGYGKDGHRMKNVAGAINWVHSLIGAEQLAQQCLFGEHILGGNVEPLPTESIALVESEKTAIIMSLVMPNKTWLATGGKQNFKHDVLWPICEMDVDALDDWSKKIEVLNREYGYRMYIPDDYRNMCTPEARKRKWDLADMMLESI